MKTETTTHLRKDLSPQQREKAERIGRLDYKSPRNPFKYRAHETIKFIPSREQH